MDNIENIKYIYHTNTLLEVFIIICIVASLLKPRLLVALSTAILLLRPNERMLSEVSFTFLLIPALFVVCVICFGKYREDKNGDCLNYLRWFILLAIAETLVFHIYDFVNVCVFVLSGYLLFRSIIVFMSDDHGIKLLSVTTVICCFLICFEPFYYHITEIEGSDLWNVFHLPKSGRLQAWGMWANANETAFIACIGVSNMAFIAVRYKNALYYMAMVLLIPFFSLIIFLTASRAGFASLLLIFLPSVILAKNKSIRVVAVMVILVATVLSHFWTPERTDAEGSANDRYELRRRGRIIIQEHPFFGVGLLKARYEAGSRPLHNTYLQAFAETGLVGGCLLMMFLLRIGYDLCFAVKNNCQKYYNNYLNMVLGLYCSCIFYFYWGNQLLSLLFYIVTAQMIIAINNSRSK